MVTVKQDVRPQWHPTAVGDHLRAAVLVLLMIGSMLPPTGLPLNELSAIVAVPFIIHALVRRAPSIHPALRVVALLALLFGAVVYLRPPDSDYGIGKAQNLFAFTLFTALAAALLGNPEQVVRWARLWLISGVCLSLFALLGDVDGAGRSIGMAGNNPIWLARAIGSPAVALVWLVYQRRIPRSTAIPAGLLLTAGLAATGSRGPAVAMLIGITLVFATVGRQQRLARVAIVLTPILVAGYAAASFGLISADSRIGAFIADPADTAYSSNRLDLARPTLTLIADHPAGVGIGRWAEYAGVARVAYPHNLWLEVLSEAGWIVGGLFILIVARTVWQLSRTSRSEQTAALVLALLAFEIVVTSVSGDLNARTLFFMLALGHCVSRWPAERAGQRRARRVAPPRIGGVGAGVPGRSEPAVV
ncbi:O-antigen ligase family protein [Micromonospora tulbaghiae]|uniref:O-antigen ligase family protein n=1 Tax=Micromonospora tulbaghiae TaxID=479978 RepID=UPI00343C5CE9